MGLAERWNALSSTRWQTIPRTLSGQTRRSRSTSLCVMKSEGRTQRVPTSCHLPFKCYAALVRLLAEEEPSNRLQNEKTYDQSRANNHENQTENSADEYPIAF